MVVATELILTLVMVGISIFLIRTILVIPVSYTHLTLPTILRV